MTKGAPFVFIGPIEVIIGPFGPFEAIIGPIEVITGPNVGAIPFGIIIVGAIVDWVT
jgi:hypothetical protein